MYFFSESDEVSIPKLGDHKFSTLAELLLEQDEKRKISTPQTSMSLRNTVLLMLILYPALLCFSFIF